jgi:hypothetical protein
MNTTGTVSIHDQFVILTTALNVELVVAAAVAVAGLEVVQQSITEHQRPLANIQFDGVTGILLGNVISEGGRHRCLAYEPIIGAYGGVSAPSVPPIQLDILSICSSNWRRIFSVVYAPVALFRRSISSSIF